MDLTIYAFMCENAAAGSLYSIHRQKKRLHMWLCITADVPAKNSKFRVMCTCAGTIVFVAVLLLVTKKQQHFSWVLTSYQVYLTVVGAFVPKS